MGGPNVQRLNNAGQPSLTQPGLNLLQSIFGGGMSGGASSMQQMGGQQGLNPLVNRGTAFGNLQSTFGSPLSPGISNTLTQFATGPNPGQNVLNQYEPLFQRNLQQIQGSGPRFSSGNDILRERSLQDFNAFAGQTLMG